MARKLLEAVKTGFRQEFSCELWASELGLFVAKEWLMGSKHGVAIVGCGQVAGMHAALLRRDAVRLLWVVGRVADRAARFAREHSVEQYSTSLSDVLEDPNVSAVFICSPSQDHAAHAEACLRAGKHVLVEIPLALSPVEGRLLETLADRAGLVVMVGHNHRYMAGIRWLSERIQAGSITVLSANARYMLMRRQNVGSNGYKRSWTDSLMWHHGQHSLDIVLAFLDVQDVSTVEVVASATGPARDLGRPMDLTIAIKTARDQMGTVTGSYNSHISIYDYVVAAREDTFVIGDGIVRNQSGIVLDYSADTNLSFLSFCTQSNS